MLKILAIYPAFDPAINEMAMSWQRLCRENPAHCTVLARSVDQLKAHASRSREENLHNLEIRRISAAPASPEGRRMATEIARRIRPDVIFCAVSHNMPAALDAQRAVSAPIVLHTEYFLDDTMGIRRRAYLGMEWLRPRVHRRFRERLLSQCRLILCSNPVEFRNPLPDALAAQVQYLPWPHPGRRAEPETDLRDTAFSAHIGSIGRVKGAEVLRTYFTALLEALPNFRLSLIGPATDRTGLATIGALRAAGGDRVETRAHCSRAEALELIGRSLFVLSPGRRLGWGLLGDAWSSGTPVIALGDHYDLEPSENCLIAQDCKAFLNHVVRLQQDKSLRQTLAMAGYRTASQHSVESASAALMQALEQAVGRRHEPTP